ncbi:tRNA pseudouridine(55) synthase TruB [Ningiella sp. W23]|uniref:tRNA pseudouridine(55) synthase TruB n=1 Tax=Ningiella sp. W23 TaxID=3023715 RepID=UPI0037572C78
MARRRKGRAVNGILLIDKHTGESSNNIVGHIKRLYGAAKAGHTGALDPLATGMLPVCLGEATKFSQFLLDADKTYEVVAKLGVRTDTSDADGEVVSEAPVNVDLPQIKDALKSFIGNIEQVPSMFSALKHEGRPLYYYARKGIHIQRDARKINVYSNQLLSFEGDLLKLRIHCSKGTYIRTIVDDLGQLLGCGAHVAELRRTGVADFPEQMHSVSHYQKLVSEIESTEQKHQMLDNLLLPMDLPVRSLAPVILSEYDMAQLQHGQQIAADAFSHAEQSLAGQVMRVYGPHERFLGVATLTDELALQAKRLVVYPEQSHD